MSEITSLKYPWLESPGYLVTHDQKSLVCPPEPWDFTLIGALILYKCMSTVYHLRVFVVNMCY